MMGLLKKGNKVWFTETNNLKRKLRYTLQLIEINGKKIGINTHLTNKIFYEALLKSKKLMYYLRKKNLVLIQDSIFL
jgi:DNA-binding sugar fermentation-stimulating protein